MFLACAGGRPATHPSFRGTHLGIVTHSWVMRVLPSTGEDDEFSKHLQLRKKGKKEKKIKKEQIYMKERKMRSSFLPLRLLFVVLGETG